MIRVASTVWPGLCQWLFAIDGMRNPMNSWDKSDTVTGEKGYIRLGEKDKALMIRLIQGGTEHRKFLRMLPVMMEITAPMYWWKEFDTYKVGTVRNSCSTMHKVMAKEFERKDFSMDGLQDNELDGLIAKLNTLRSLYLNCDEGERKQEYWRKVIMLLPSCYNVRANVSFNYENALNMLLQRRYHRLSEWRTFTDELLSLPYMKHFVECLEEE